MSTITATSRDRLDSGDEGPSPVPGTENAPQRPGGDATARERGVEVRFPGSDVTRTAEAAWLATHLADAAAVLGAAIAEVTVTVVGDQRMRGLHRTWKGVDLTTDVLTFRHSAPCEPIEADIVVCADEAARRARDLGHDERSELLLYALHGLLHCAGHEDDTEAGFAAMHAEEDRLLAAIGVGATFGRGPRETRRD